MANALKVVEEASRIANGSVDALNVSMYFRTKSGYRLHIGIDFEVPSLSCIHVMNMQDGDVVATEVYSGAFTSGRLVSKYVLDKKVRELVSKIDKKMLDIKNV